MRDAGEEKIATDGRAQIASFLKRKIQRSGISNPTCRGPRLVTIENYVGTKFRIQSELIGHRFADRRIAKTQNSDLKLTFVGW